MSKETTPPVKLCRTCNTKYPATTEFFTKCSSNKDGLYRKCKACQHIDNKKQTVRRRDWAKEYMKSRRADPIIGEVLRERANKRKIHVLNTSLFSMKNITQDIAQKHFTYYPETGVLVYNGDCVYSTYNYLGYSIMYIDGTKYQLHRFIWFYVYGTWVDIIDHINGDKQDNRITNLRDANTRENALNNTAARNGKLPGAYRYSNKKWKSIVNSIDGCSVVLGIFDTERSASLAYCKYCIQHSLVRREFLPSIFTDAELYSK
jgi:hypothetical protein